jgi:hypothetical protein
MVSPTMSKIALFCQKPQGILEINYGRTFWTTLIYGEFDILLES